MSFDAGASVCTTPQSAPDGLWDSSVASDIEAHVLERRDSVMLDAKAKAGSMNYQDHVNRLNKYYRQVKKQIMRYQSPTTGLFPADLSKSNNQEAHVRDSLYCANALWALSQAYKRIDDDKGRTHELAQSAVKCMRGILECWLRQADKLERFKQSQTTKNALHSKFNLMTGNYLTKDDEFEHLQIDAVALYLIFLVQMLRSGLKIIFTADEVSFIQNLVFYVERAYRTPDFGMWERGTKYNNGSTELHASSIGLAKAALESINGENLYGDQGAAWTVIYVDIDAHNRNRTIFNTILPRESNSKNTDASLIPTVSWPAFAMHEEHLVTRTVDKALRKLKGKYGLKRYLRDGYGTVVEDKTVKYYKPAEVKNYDGIECEWPIFFAYLIIDSVYKKNPEKVKQYQELLKPLLVQTPDGPIIPKYYYIPEESIDREREKPGSQTRLAYGEESGERGANLFLWGQSVYIISQLLVEGLLSVKELDPTRRNLPAAERPRTSLRYSSFQNSPNDLVVQVLLIAESVRLQQMLATYGIQTQTPHQIEPIQIWSPNQLVKAYEQLGLNTKLGLTGRPPRPIGHLGTSKIYRACGRTFICYPLLFQLSEFYLSQDMEFVIDDVRSDLTFLSRSWKLAGRPTFCIIIREDNLRGAGTHHIFDLLAEFKRGDCNGTKVRLGRLQEFISSACIEHLDFIDIDDDIEMCEPFEEKDLGKQFRSLTDIPKITKVEQAERWHDTREFCDKSIPDMLELYSNTDNMFFQAQLLQAIMDTEGLHYKIGSQTVEQALEKLSQQAGTRQMWAVVRFCSGLLGKIVDSLAPSITAILVRGKQVTIGVWGGEEEVIDKPPTPSDIKTILYTRCYPHDVSQAVLQQELIINIGTYISTNPEFFHGMLKIRIGWIVQAMKLELKYTTNDTDTSIHSVSPSDIRKLLLRVVKRDNTEQRYYSEHRTMLWNRQLDGALNRVPLDFYDRVWHILERTAAGIKVAGYHLPQQPTLSDMTLYELNFSLLVEQMLSRIIDPAYRQIIVETFMIVDGVLSRNPELSFQKPVDMDRLVQEAFEQFKVDRAKAGHVDDDMTSFYDTAPTQTNGTTLYKVRAIMNNLLDAEFSGIRNFNCAMC